MITACISERFSKSSKRSPFPESSEYRSTFESSAARVCADLSDLEYTALRLKSFEALTAGF